MIVGGRQVTVQLLTFLAGFLECLVRFVSIPSATGVFAVGGFAAIVGKPTSGQSVFFCGFNVVASFRITLA